MVKGVVGRYADNVMATTSTVTSLGAYLVGTATKVTPSLDVPTRPPNSYNSVPEPVRYWNYMVGESKDLIFGVSLVDYATSHSSSSATTAGSPHHHPALPSSHHPTHSSSQPLPSSSAVPPPPSSSTAAVPPAPPTPPHDLTHLIPKVIRLSIAFIDSRGLSSEGIYRVSGRHAAVQSLQRSIERDESLFEFPENEDVYAVASLLKLYLRELPEPVFRYPLSDRRQHGKEGPVDWAVVRGRVRRLPPVHHATLKLLLEHLHRVYLHRETNKMDARNLSIVFAAVIFGEEDGPGGPGTGTPQTAQDLLSVQGRDVVMEELIERTPLLFEVSTDDGGGPPTAVPTPQRDMSLPAHPPGESAAPVAYGSAHTKVAISTAGITPSPGPASAPASSTNATATSGSQGTVASTTSTGTTSTMSTVVSPTSFTTATPTTPDGSGNDFNPRLPARPADSIHPSARSGTGGGGAGGGGAGAGAGETLTPARKGSALEAVDENEGRRE